MRNRHQILIIQKSELRKTRYGMMLPIMLLILMFLVFSSNQSIANAQGGGTGGNTDYFTLRTIIRDGKSIDEMIINGPPTPPPGFELERAAVKLPEPNPGEATNTLTVPAFNWVFGCSSVSGAMIAGYYDRNGYPNMYTGPTDGGVMPLDNSSWGTWSDGVDTYPNLPLAASHNGVDGRVTKGSIDDYWVEYGSSASDPYITGSWTQHTWGTAIGDYMKTSQSAYGNTDGSTMFYNWTDSATKLTCADMVSLGVQNEDGTYGRKLFYEARGYTVTDCYNQKTDNTIAGGFSYAQLKAEINAGRPVMLNLAGHTIVAVGYSDPSTVYVHDTWDYLDHSMTWGTSYSGMQLLSVSIVNLSSSTPSTGFSSNFNGSSSGWVPVRGTWGIYNSVNYYSNGLASKVVSSRHTGSYSNFSYQARMRRTGACTTCANRLIIRGKPSSLTSYYEWKPSYNFQYDNAGSFSVFEITSTGYTITLKDWTLSSAIVKKGWNTLKVIANGSGLKFYINGTLVWNGSDPTLTSGTVGLGFYRDTSTGTLYVDSAVLTTLADLNPFEIEEVAPGVETPGGTVNMAP